MASPGFACERHTRGNVWAGIPPLAGERFRERWVLIPKFFSRFFRRKNEVFGAFWRYFVVCYEGHVPSCSAPYMAASVETWIFTRRATATSGWRRRTAALQGCSDWCVKVLSTTINCCLIIIIILTRLPRSVTTACHAPAGRYSIRPHHITTFSSSSSSGRPPISGWRSNEVLPKQQVDMHIIYNRSTFRQGSGVIMRM